MSLKSKNLTAGLSFLEKDIDGVIRKIPLRDIKPSLSQPRLNKDISIEYLAKSLEAEGLLQPIIVTKTDNYFMIIAGERRFRAATLLKWSEIECRIINRDEKEAYKLAVIENLQREDLDPFEESLAYKTLKNKFSYTDNELSEILGKSRSYITELLTITDLSDDIRSRAREVGISSKNMLIQLSQAYKNNLIEDFFFQFETGSITSVKGAKEFLQANKNIDKSQPISVKNENKPIVETIVAPPYITPIQTYPSTPLDIVSKTNEETNKKVSSSYETIDVKQNVESLNIEIKQNKENNLLIRIEIPALENQKISINNLEHSIRECIQNFILLNS